MVLGEGRRCGEDEETADGGILEDDGLDQENMLLRPRLGYQRCRASFRFQLSLLLSSGQFMAFCWPDMSNCY